MKSVTNDGWSVSVTTGSHIEGAVLSLTKSPVCSGRASRTGDWNKRVFPTSNEAFQFALERGYLTEYINADVAFAKKVYRTQLASIMNKAIAVIRNERTREWRDVVRIATWASESICRECKLTRLSTLRWSNALYSLAFKFRPAFNHQEAI